MNPRETYELGAAAAHGFIMAWLERGGEPPRFAFPPKEIALIADLGDVGTSWRGTTRRTEWSTS